MIGRGPLRAGISPFGAALWDLRLDGVGQSLVLGFASNADYIASRTHAGAVIGRVCNRLRGARAMIAGRELRLQANRGSHQIHGGTTGFSQQVWRVLNHDADRLELGLHSPDGHEGYPGALAVRATYSVEHASLRLDLLAQSKAATIVNLCHHPYFMLPGTAGSRGHRLWVDATHALAVNPDGYPTGALDPVAMFAGAVAPGPKPGAIPKGLDRTFVLATKTRDSPVRVAVLAAGLRMEIWTTQPALHVYDGGKIQPGVRLRDGRTTGPFAGVALEAQGWTDAPNHPTFPAIDLPAGTDYRQTTIYSFSDLSGPRP